MWEMEDEPGSTSEAEWIPSAARDDGKLIYELSIFLAHECWSMQKHVYKCCGHTAVIMGKNIHLPPPFFFLFFFLTPQNHKISDPHPSTSMSMKCFCSWKTTAAMRIRLIMMQCCGGKEERKKKKRKKIYSEFELNELSIHNILEWNPSNIKGLHRGRMNLWRQYKICVGWG